MPNGRIEGYFHPNESRWGLEDGVVVFYAANGQASCKFTDIRQENGKCVMSGKFLFDNVTTHYLTGEWEGLFTEEDLNRLNLDSPITVPIEP